MARRRDHPCRQGAYRDSVAFCDLFIHVRNLKRLGTRRHHPGAVALLQFADPGGVVAMMMGYQNVGQSPARRRQCRLDRRGFRRVDCRSGAARRIVDEDAVIVLEAEEKAGLSLRGRDTCVIHGTPFVDQDSITCGRWPRSRSIPRCASWYLCAWMSSIFAISMPIRSEQWRGGLFGAAFADCGLAAQGCGCWALATPRPI